MAANARTKQPPSLAQEIKCGRAIAEGYIDERVAELKASNDGKALPVELLRDMLTKHNDCACAVALYLLAERGEK